MRELPKARSIWPLPIRRFNIGYEYDVYDDRLESRPLPRLVPGWTGEAAQGPQADGTFWLAIGDEYAAELKVMLQREHGLTCRSWVIWYYTFGVNCKNKFSRSHAHLFHYGEGPAEVHVQYRRSRFASRRPGNWSTATSVPIRTAACRTTRGSCGRRTCPSRFRPTKTPGTFPRVRHVQGTRRLARLPDARTVARTDHSRCSNPGEVVLDPFGGSGTTLAVAKKLGRKSSA